MNKINTSTSTTSNDLRQIAYIAKSRIPSRFANSVHVMKMCQAFQQEGYETTLFVPRSDDDRQANIYYIWHHYGIKTHFSIEYVAARGYLKPYFGWHAFAMKSAWRAKRRRVPLVYTRDVLGAFWASRMGIPTIYEVHAPVQQGKFGLGSLAAIRGRGFRRLVVISQALKRIWLEEAVGLLQPEQIVVAPDGVDLERFVGLELEAARKLAAISSSSFVVGYAGHMYPGRGIELVLELARRLPAVHFLLVGGMEDAIRECKEKIQALGLTNVNLVGFVPNSDLPKYLIACDALLMPYQRQVSVTHDGHGDTASIMSPMKMFEYMATGRLIISSNLPVLREVLNEANAVLCDPDRVDAWQRAIERAMADREWRDRIGAQAWCDVTQYTWRQRVHRVLSGLSVISA